MINELKMAPIAIRDVKSVAMLNVLRQLTRTGAASFSGGFYSLEWRSAK